MCKTMGWAPRGERLVDHAPFGHSNTQTFIAALRHDRLDAPRVLSGLMNRVRFESYVETQLAPTLNRGDLIIPDNLSRHHSVKVRHVRDLFSEGRLNFFIAAGYEPDQSQRSKALCILKAIYATASSGR